MSATPPESRSPSHIAKESDKFISGGVKKAVEEGTGIQLSIIKESGRSHRARTQGDSFDGADHSINEADGEGESLVKSKAFKISFYSWLTLDWVYQLIRYYRVDPSKSKGKHLI